MRFRGNLFKQRNVDMRSFCAALKNNLRQAPDVVHGLVVEGVNGEDDGLKFAESLNSFKLRFKLCGNGIPIIDSSNAS